MIILPIALFARRRVVVCPHIVLRKRPAAFKRVFHANRISHHQLCPTIRILHRIDALLQRVHLTSKCILEIIVMIARCHKEARMVSYKRIVVHVHIEMMTIALAHYTQIPYSGLISHIAQALGTDNIV